MDNRTFASAISLSQFKPLRPPKLGGIPSTFRLGFFNHLTSTDSSVLPRPIHLVRFISMASIRQLHPCCFNSTASPLLLQFDSFTPAASTRQLHPYCFPTRQLPDFDHPASSNRKLHLDRFTLAASPLLFPNSATSRLRSPRSLHQDKQMNQNELTWI